MFRIHIGEGRDIDIELPAALMNTAGVSQAAAPPAVQGAGLSTESIPEAPGQDGEKVVRTLTRKHYKITEVKRGPKTEIKGTTCISGKELKKNV